MQPPNNFEQVVHQYYRDLFRFAMSLVNQEADAIDLTQQTFLKYATKGHQLRDQAKVKSWLFQALKNDFIDQHRRSKRYQHVQLESAASHSQMLTTGSSSADKLSGIDTNSALEALQTLDEKYRIPLTLFYLEGLSYKEIATAMEIPDGTVMSRLSRGKEKLRAAFATPTQPRP